MIRYCRPWAPRIHALGRERKAVDLVGEGGMDVGYLELARLEFRGWLSLPMIVCTGADCDVAKGRDRSPFDILYASDHPQA